MPRIFQRFFQNIKISLQGFFFTTFQGIFRTSPSGSYTKSKYILIFPQCCSKKSCASTRIEFSRKFLKNSFFSFTYLIRVFFRKFPNECLHLQEFFLRFIFFSLSPSSRKFSWDTLTSSYRELL